MFENIKILLEIAFSKAAVNTYWEPVDRDSSIGYFSPTNDEHDVYFINVKHGQLDDFSTLIFSFGFFSGTKDKIALTKRNEHQYKIFATVIKEIHKIIAKLDREKLIILFSAKRENDSEPDYQRRVTLYSLLAETEQKKLGCSLGRLDVDDGKLFYLSDVNISKMKLLRILSEANLLSASNVKQLFKGIK